MQTSLHLNFNGECEAAFRFYERTLGGKVDFLMPYEGSPAAEQVPAEWRKKVLHAHLSLNGQSLMGCDAPPARYQQPQGFSVSVSIRDAGEAERIFRALEEGGQVRMPMQETFWADRFGMLVDRFGIPWMVNCDKVAQEAKAEEPEAVAS